MEVNNVKILSHYKAIKKRINKTDISQKFFTPNLLNNLLHYPVSLKSVFSDAIWDFNLDLKNASPNTLGSSLKVNFSSYKFIPTAIIIELKCLLLLIKTTPGTFANFGNKRAQSMRLSIVTICQQVTLGMNFYDHLLECLTRQLGREYVETSLSSLNDIPLTFYKEAAKSFPSTFSTDLKRFFDHLHNPMTSKYILEEPIVAFDPLTFEWAKFAKSNRGSTPCLSNKMFEVLIRESSYIVIEFLLNLKMNVNCKTSLKYLGTHKNSYADSCGFSKSRFDLYIIIRLWRANYDHQFIEKNYGEIPKILLKKINGDERTGNSYVEILIRNGILDFNLRDFSNYLRLVAYAARYLIAQYSGMRPSELSSLDIDNCLTSELGFTLFKSHQVKGTDSLIGGLFDDKWVAIPIMLDAFNALKEVLKVTQRKLLFSSGKMIQPGDFESKQKAITINAGFQFLMKSVSPEKQEKIHCRTVRHTLAHQLFRVEAGLPAISFQLKHIVNTVDSFLSRNSTSDVTLGYGEIGKIIVDRTTSTSLTYSAELEKIKSTFDPDNTYLGGKAEQHKDNLRKLFEGYMAAGYTKDEIFKAMANQNMGVVSVGLGYCYGSNDNDDPSLPCIGSLKCNPVRCKQAVVTKSNVANWKIIYQTNLSNLNNPAYEQNKEQIAAAIEESKAVIDYFEGGE